MAAFYFFDFGIFFYSRCRLIRIDFDGIDEITENLYYFNVEQMYYSKIKKITSLFPPLK